MGLAPHLATLFGRREFLRLAAALGLVASSLSLPALDSSSVHRPNILWLVAEDMGPALSCYGVPEVSTPNLDQLVATGVRFDQYFSNSPV